MLEYRNKAANYLLENSIFNNKLKNLELSFSAECDKACYYCYIKDYGDKLFPPEKTSVILDNLSLLLDYCYNHDYKFDSIDIFSGEFFNLSYWQDVLDILLKSKFTNYNKICIPTNFSFVDKNLSDQIYEYKNRFENINKRFHLSCSIDGANDYETRPNITNQKNNIENILNNIDRFKAGMHPMVSPRFLDNYKENVDFWIDVTQRFNRSPMFLEVRNDFWDSDHIKLFSDFMFYLTEQFYEKIFNKNSEIFAKVFFRLDPDLEQYNCFLLDFPRQLQRISCSFQSTIFIRVSDLSLIPCHRLAYPKFIYGKFVKCNNDLKFESSNLDFHITATTFNPSSFLPKCSNCNIRMFCSKGCLGSQFEINNDPLIPIDSVCSLLKEKYLTLHKIAKKYNLYEICLNDPLLSPQVEASIRYIITVLNNMEESNTDA